MLVHLVVTVLVAGAVCLLLWAFFRQTGRQLPGYALPMVGAVVAICYGIYAEYSWASRIESGLPESIVVLERIEGRSALAPWTWIVPRVLRFSAIDTRNMKRHPRHSRLRYVDLLLFQRFNPVLRVSQWVDCDSLQVADRPEDATFDGDGVPIGLVWREPDNPEAFLPVACETR